MRKLSFFTIFLLVGLAAFSQPRKSKVVIFKPEFPETILASANDVTDFLHQWFIVRASFDKLKVESNGKKYFMMALDKQEAKTVVFRLRKMNGKYCISPLDRISICKCGHMDMDKFSFKKNKMNGCADCGLSTAGAL